MRTRVLAALAIPLLAVACASSVPTADADRAIVIQVTLIAGAPSQLLSATWEQTTDSPGISAPIADTVQLWLINDAGDSAQFVPAGGVGSYSSALPVLSGRSYRLRGAIGGTRVNDSTLIPGNVTIRSPAAVDTIVVTAIFGTNIAVRWTGPAVATYATSEVVDGQLAYIPLVYADTSAIFTVPYRAPPALPTRIRVMAVDARTVARRGSDGPMLPRGGVLVILGSVAIDSVIVVTVR